MKYQRLTKEQLEELHPEFINFLATQSITGEEWASIKEKQPEVAEQELDVFSDLIWEGVLSKAKYLQNSDPQQLFLFKISEANIALILVKVQAQNVDITTNEGFQWLLQNIEKETVELFTASKEYNSEKNQEVFELILQGAVITDGKVYEQFATLILE